MGYRFPAEVPGWLLESEGAVLAECARGRVVLEIGSYHGRSTVCMAREAKVVHAIDHGCGDQGAGYRRTTADLLETLRRYGVDGRVVVHVGATVAVGRVMADAAFDFAFVDGAHDALSVFNDLAVVRRVVRPGGVIALHDWQLDGVLWAAERSLGWRPDDGIGVTLDSRGPGGDVYRMHVRAWGGAEGGNG
jgi:predicted O-methyltransferase YrrM